MFFILKLCLLTGNKINLLNSCQFLKTLDSFFFFFYHFIRFLLSSVQLLSCIQLFVTPWTAVHQASLFITNTRSLFKFMSIESVMPSNHLILCCPLLLPSIFPSIRVFSNKSVIHIRWPKYWSFSFSISPSNEYSGLISFRIDWFGLLAVQETLKSVLLRFLLVINFLYLSSFLAFGLDWWNSFYSFLHLLSVSISESSTTPKTSVLKWQLIFFMVLLIPWPWQDSS